MVYEVFTFLLSHKFTRKMLLLVKHTPLKKLVKMLQEWNEKDYIFQTPQFNLLGHDSIEKLNKYLSQDKNKKCLIISTKISGKTGIIKSVLDQFDLAKKDYALFDGVVPNPTLKCVNEAIKIYETEKCDCLLSIGGGSSHDTAKAVSLVIANHEKHLVKYQGLNATKNKTPSIICINTTAGSGSEVTNVAVITNEETHFKMTLVDKHMNAKATVNDSNLMISMPDKVTSSTGLDTLVHGIEAYLSNISNLQSDAHALSAIKLVFNNLPKAFKTPNDINAREKMAYAEYLAGIAFNYVSLGFIHSMSHALSAVYNIPHGLANAMLLPYVLEYELKYDCVVDKLNSIATSLGILKNSKTDNAIEFIKMIKKLLNSVEISNSLIIEGHEQLNKEELNALAKKAMKDFCGISNPIQFSKKQIIEIYKNALENKHLYLKD